MKIEMPDELELCDDCGFEFDKKELYICPLCKHQLCKFCQELHEHENEHEHENNPWHPLNDVLMYA